MLYPVELRARRSPSSSEGSLPRRGNQRFPLLARPATTCRRVAGLPFRSGTAVEPRSPFCQEGETMFPLPGTNPFHKGMAERLGFEPRSRLSAATRFPIAFFQPLRHLSIVNDGLGLSPMVKRTERVGFEPTRPLRAYRFSRAAPSTGLEPPLR